MLAFGFESADQYNTIAVSTINLPANVGQTHVQQAVLQLKSFKQK